jgi:hypothetical protein
MGEKPKNLNDIDTAVIIPYDARNAEGIFIKYDR